MTAHPSLPTRDLTLVLDVGKTHAKLLLIDAEGQVQAQHRCDNQPLSADQAYVALDVARLRAWWLQAVQATPAALRARVARLIATTHGAAFCALGPAAPGAPSADAAWAEGGLAFPPMDYEWDGHAALRHAEAAQLDAFTETGSPDLPMGLNAGWQLRWLQRERPQDWARVEHWLPYPQYWAWWWSGVRASERSSLGCHTHLWSVAHDRPSPWAQRLGLTERLAPLRQAHEVLGTLRPELAAQCGLPDGVDVLCGVHDSNACLARYQPLGRELTLVSTGTWTVVMSPAGDPAGLRAEHDQLVNVSVSGEPVPTARFMGGREFAHLCDGASPDLATLATLDGVLAQEWWATPGFASAGGPFAHQQGQVWRGWDPAMPVSAAAWQQASPAVRATLASLYVAQTTAWLVATVGGRGPVIVEGPQVHNPVIMAVLSTLLSPRSVLRSTDEMEGTARGAWRLAQPVARAASGGKRGSAAPGARARHSAIFAETIPPLQGMSLERLRTLHTSWAQSLMAPLVPA
jgi:L-fuculokinase